MPTDNQKKGVIIFLCILGVITVLMIVSLFYLAKKVDEFQVADETDQNLGNELTQHLKSQKNYSRPEGDPPEEHVLGATSSPEVTVVEFSDFNCPSSRNMYSKIRRMGAKYEDKVKIVFRDYPITTEESMLLSLAANCAGDQDLFWSMHDKLFQNQGEIESEQLPRIAERIGADKQEFQRCLEQEKFSSKIARNLQDGADMNIKGTPTLFINGYKISGDIPYDLLTEIIEGMINDPLNKRSDAKK